MKQHQESQFSRQRKGKGGLQIHYTNMKLFFIKIPAEGGTPVKKIRLKPVFPDSVRERQAADSLCWSKNNIPGENSGRRRNVGKKIR